MKCARAWVVPLTAACVVMYACGSEDDGTKGQSAAADGGVDASAKDAVANDAPDAAAVEAGMGGSGGDGIGGMGLGGSSTASACANLAECCNTGVFPDASTKNACNGLVSIDNADNCDFGLSAYRAADYCE